MQINPIGLSFTGGTMHPGRLVYVHPTTTITPLAPYNRHEQNIIRTIGLDKYNDVCSLAEVDETKKLAYLLKNLDDRSMIILGNPYTDDNEQSLANHINKHPELMERIETAYIVPCDYENAVFITKSDKEDNIGVEYFMVHSDGKLRIQTPFWSLKQSGTLKDTRYLRPGDVFRVEKDNHYVKLDSRNVPAEKPKGISTIEFVDLL